MASTYLPHRLRYHTWSIISRLEEDCSCGNAACLKPEGDGGGSIGSSLLDQNCFDKQVWEHHGVCEDLSMKEMSLSKVGKPVRFSDSMYRSILKEALSRALADIDSAFSNEARKKDRQGGSTAVVVLKADRHLLAANIGDSKAIVCSSCSSLSGFCQDFNDGKFQEVQNIGISMDEFPILVKELTVDHRPNRLDERARIEAAGGFISTWNGVPRVNGQLAITRAIGDVPFKKYGVTAEPEFTDWQEITLNESFLFLASDGIFETMKTQDVCNMLQEKHEKFFNLLISGSESSDAKVYSQALAEAVVDLAFERGSMDNLALVVYPLRACPGQQPTSCGIEDCENKGLEHDIFVQQNNNLIQSGLKSDNCKDPHSSTGLPFSSTENKVNQDKLLAAFSTVASGSLLKGREETSCYELVERVPGGVVLKLQTLVDSDAVEVMENVTEVEGLFGINLSKALPYEQSTGQLEVYYAHPVCLLSPVLSDDDEVCLNPERFATYLRLIEAVPVVENNFAKAVDWEARVIDPAQYHSYTRIHQRYVLTKNVGRGGFGEVWFAVAQHCLLEGKMRWPCFKQAPSGSAKLQNIELGFEGDCSSNTSKPETRPNLDRQKEIFVLKRILVEKGDAVYLSGIREKYFGEVFESARNLVRYKQREGKKKKMLKEDEEEEKTGDGLKHIVRYVESFQVNMQGDLWLVFLNEGYPLSSLLYTVDRSGANEEELNGRGHIQVLQPSNWWKWLKTTEDGQQEMRSLIYQLLLAVKACHDRNITHRDIKPENMMIRATNGCSVTGEDGQLRVDMPCNLSMRIIDFGSAIDRYSLLNLYAPEGPSRAEQTAEYTPPESFLQRNWLQFHGNHATMYDMWSIGVVLLELVLGTPHVFQISARTRALLDQRLEGWDQPALDTAYKLRALLEICILFAGHRAHHHQNVYSDSFDLASWRCTEENIMQQIKERDPLGIGLPDVWALRLLRGLLQWYPEARISAEEALRHPYFHPTLQGKEDKT